MKMTEAQRAAQARFEAQAAEDNAFRRFIATRLFFLHEVCDLARCRRARRCDGPGLPDCILTKKAHYMHLLPELQRLLEQDMPEADAPATTPAGPAGRRAAP